MFPAAIIVFREIFEIVLIVGVVFAATKDIPSRNKWVLAGAGIGILGSVLMAFFTNVITDLGSGIGQEVTNAIVLFVAAGFIGWTVLWMQKHAKEMRSKFTKLSSDIAEGNTHCYILMMIVAFTILREGTEIVLFTYGMIASGQSIASILSGALLGGVAGLLIGVLFYIGLVNIPLKYFFRITSWLLILLVAGMISQAIGFLSAAGLLSENLSRIVWNSSSILSESSVLGRTLEALIGYTSQPNLAQLFAYFTVILLFSLFTTNLKSLFVSKRKF